MFPVWLGIPKPMIPYPLLGQGAVQTIGSYLGRIPNFSVGEVLEPPPPPARSKSTSQPANSPIPIAPPRTPPFQAIVGGGGWLASKLEELPPAPPPPPAQVSTMRVCLHSGILTVWWSYH